jgi:hypothetical protein
LQLSEKEVMSVLDIYWDMIRKTLSSLEHNRLYLRGLGTFYIKHWAVSKKIKINNAVIAKYTENPTSGSLTIINELMKDNLKLNKVWDKEVESKQEWNRIKDERRNQNLEGEEQDS